MGHALCCVLHALTQIFTTVQGSSFYKWGNWSPERFIHWVSSIGIRNIVVWLQSSHPSLCTRLRLKKKKKKGGRRFSVSPEGNYSRKQNVIRVLSKAEVREGTARQSCPGERVLQRDSLGQASLPSRPALGLLGVWEPTWILILLPSFF